MFNIIGNNIRNARLSRGWSQRFLAIQINISHQTISRLENGHAVSRTMLKKIVGILQIPLIEVYKERENDEPIRNHISDNVMEKLFLNSQPLIESIFDESVARYKQELKSKGVLLRSDIEDVIKEYFKDKTQYSFNELVYVGMLANQKTLQRAMTI